MPKNKNIKRKPNQAAGGFLRVGSGGTVVVANTTEDNMGEQRQAHKLVRNDFMGKG
tara:strand:- start:4996 stop:5163 length:168 start_codon:yes stop_codon:yes gene_type:complete